MRSACTAIVAMLCACTVGDVARPSGEGRLQEVRDFASGSRLLAQAWDVDGVLVLRQFYDRDRDEACAFVEDGVWHVGPGPSYYCLPLAMARHDSGFGALALFANGKCTEPVAASPATGAAAYAFVRPPDACAAPPSVYRAGKAEVYVPWVFDGASCVRASTEVMVQPLGELVALDAFVRAEEHAEERESRVGALVATSGDGARFTVGGYDRLRSEPVRIEDRVAGGMRWVPSRVAFEGAGEVLFEDAMCSAAVPTKIARDAICPLTATLAFDDDECGTARFHLLGTRLARVHARGAKGTCTAVEREGVFAFERGAQIDPAVFAPAFVVEVGGAHVRRRGFTGPGGGIATWGDLVDVATKEPCTPVRASDGSARCLPLASAAVSLFADEACSEPAFEEPVDPCKRSRAPRYVQSSGPSGARAFEVIGEKKLFELTEGACRPHTSVVPSRGYAVREVDVATFPEVREREL